MAVLLLVAGVAAGIVFRGPIRAVGRTLFPPAQVPWEEQIRADARSLLAVVKPDPRLPETLDGQTEFWAGWNERRALYAPPQLEDLRRRLDDYLLFLESEYMDAAEIYRSGLPDTAQSDASKQARERIRSGFGPFADVLIADAAKLRDEAYKASPKVAGYDPSRDNFIENRDDLRAWLPRARSRIAELTAPLPAR